MFESWNRSLARPTTRSGFDPFLDLHIFIAQATRLPFIIPPYLRMPNVSYLGAGLSNLICSAGEQDLSHAHFAATVSRE